MTPQEYFDTHFDPEFAAKNFGVVWDENSIRFPVFDENNNLLFTKIRNLKSGSKFTNPNGYKSLYSIHKIKQYEDIVLCEGEPDCIRLWEAGIPAVTVTTGVTSFSAEIAQSLSGKKVSICLDTDEAGQKEIDKYGRILKEVGADPYVIQLPSEFKDICEFFSLGKTKEDFKALPNLPYQHPTIEELDSIEFKVIKNEEFLKTEFPKSKWLVKKLIRTPGITLLVGEGGVGKTAITQSLMKAISGGTKWLDLFETTQSNILLLDKENESIDIQQNFIAQEINSPNIHHFPAKDFSFHENDPQTNELKQSPAATFLKNYIQEEKISVVVMDSLVDFFSGSENNSIDVANNFLTWRETFPDCAILIIHHENKPSQGTAKQAAKYRIKGNTHFYNGSQSAFSFSQYDPEDSTQILVEHTKVRGARRHNAFLIQMIVDTDPQDLQETVIKGFQFKEEVIAAKKVVDQAYEAILSLINGRPGVRFTAKDIVGRLAEFKDRNIHTALPLIRRDKAVAFDISRQPYTYWSLEIEINEELFSVDS